MKYTDWGIIFPHFTVNSLYYRTCYLVTLAQSYKVICKFNLGIFLENYPKIVSVWTAITHSSHHVKAINFQTGKILIENSENKI